VIRIPFNRPFATGKEIDYIRDAIATPKLSGDGPYTAQCHGLLEQSLGIQKALLTTSCTHALEMAALLLNIAPGDEVILPGFTFPSTANAFALRGARPVFVDIRADTLNIDASLVEARITPRTKAIVVVHYAGVACDMEAIGDIARRLRYDDAAELTRELSAKMLGIRGAYEQIMGMESVRDGQ